MKPIVLPNGKLRLRSSVKSDEIWFGLRTSSGFSFSGAAAKLTPNGTITTPRLYGIPLDNHSKWSNLLSVLSTLLFVGSLLTYIVLEIITQKEYRIFFSLFFVFQTMRFLSGALAIFLPRLFGNQEMKSFSKLLGAKNAVENAFYHLGRIPTVDEAKQFSTLGFYSPYLDFSSSAVVPLTLITAITVYFSTLWTFIVLVLMLISSALLMKKPSVETFTRLYFCQSLTVAKPEDAHYELAIAALKTARDSSLAIFSEACKDCGYYDVCKDLEALK